MTLGKNSSEKNEESRLIHRIYHVLGGSSRRKRAAKFVALFPEDCCPTIIDLGGSALHPWNELDYRSRIVLVNLDPNTLRRECELIVGDATKTAFPDKSFSLVYSNSLIEHLGTFDRQKCLAREIQRLANQVWCQTPNRWFPIEPHFLTLLLYWLPRRWLKYWMVRQARREYEAKYTAQGNYAMLLGIYERVLARCACDGNAQQPA
jgi:hypothetical protein